MEDYLTKNMSRARRRALDLSKARRKAHLAKEVYGIDYYKYLHQYSKNKIHCSCNLCRFRPNYDPDNKPMQDVRNLLDIRQQLDEVKKYA